MDTLRFFILQEPWEETVIAVLGSFFICAPCLLFLAYRFQIPYEPRLRIFLKYCVCMLVGRVIDLFVTYITPAFWEIWYKDCAILKALLAWLFVMWLSHFTVYLSAKFWRVAYPIFNKVLYVSKMSGFVMLGFALFVFENSMSTVILLLPIVFTVMWLVITCKYVNEHEGEVDDKTTSVDSTEWMML